MRNDVSLNSKCNLKMQNRRNSIHTVSENGGCFLNINDYSGDSRSERRNSFNSIEDIQIQVTSFYNHNTNNKIDYSFYNNTNNINLFKNDNPQEDLTNIMNLCKNHVGCKKLQNLIYNTDKEKANSYLYPLLQPKMLELINDQFGNFIYQQFLDVLYPENLQNLILFVFNNFNTIAFSPNGTRIVQKLIENITHAHTDMFLFVYELLYNQLRNNVPQFAVDENANHILQKFIICCKSPSTNFVYEEINNSFVRISTTKYGCCVVQKCLIHGNQEQKELIILNILKNTYKLIIDQFGNYVYQSLIFTNDERVILEIYKIIAPNFIKLCKQKYSSNVIEKLFEINNKLLVNKIAQLAYENENNVIELITDQYGNYIIQKILDCITNTEIIQTIIYILLSNVNIIFQKSFGKSLLTKLARKHTMIENYLKQKHNYNITVN